ncbi:MAG: alpha-amylase family glycosyl hydrolase [Rectinemataceae bacterium]
MTPKGPSWLSSSVFYNIYLQSFADSNGDGIGDLNGVTSKLDYIKGLGCNALWLTAFNESPFGDGGYDVSDFYRIAPRYGTNDDARRLFEAAHERGMRVCFDLVAGHTSIRHPWFRESCRHERNEFSDRFIWTDSTWEEVDPASSFVKGFAQRDGAYMTNFFWFQPALNYGFAHPDPARPWQMPVDHPSVLATKRELERIMRFWLDMGADGFKVDMASSLVKNDPDKKATMALWQGFREMVDRDYPEAALISEWSDPEKAIEAGFHIDFMLHFNVDAYMFLFRAEKWRNPHEQDRGASWFDGRGDGDIESFFRTYLEQLRATKDRGYIALPTGNHDICRLAAGRGDSELKVALGFLMTMPGIPFLYYGDEIGMRGGDPSLPSKEGGYNRSAARTPMRWTKGVNRGFSEATGEKLYLPMDSTGSDVETQSADPDSLLTWTRTLTALRATHPALGADGDIEAIPGCGRGYPFAYLRHIASSPGNISETFLIVLNPSPHSGEISLPPGMKVEKQVLRVGEIEIGLKAGITVLRCGGMSFAVLATGSASAR